MYARWWEGGEVCADVRSATAGSCGCRRPEKPHGGGADLQAQGVLEALGLGVRREGAPQESADVHSSSQQLQRYRVDGSVCRAGQVQPYRC